LQLTLRLGIGALQTALASPKAIEKRDLNLWAFGLQEDGLLGYFHAGELPLGHSHLLQIELLGPRLGLPFGFQIVAELFEL